MSDLYIPGVKSRFDTEKLIEDLMKLERVRKESAEKRVETLETQKTAWQDLGRRISGLRDMVRSLYSFQNPFSERIAFSSDSSALVAQASREASEGEYSFIIEQPATADRLLSKPLPASYQVPAGEYGFILGEQNIQFSFRGGSLREFAENLSRFAKDSLSARTLTVEPGTQSLILEGLKTGKQNRLGFSGDSEAFVLDIGLAEQLKTTLASFIINQAALNPVPGSSHKGVSLSNGTVQVPAETAIRLALDQTVKNNTNLILELEIRSHRHPEETVEPLMPPTGPSFPPTGSISYGGITIQSEASFVPLPDWQPPAAPRRVDDLAILGLVQSNGQTFRLPAVNDSDDFKPLSIKLADYPDLVDLSQLEIKNDNTHRDYEVRNLRLFDPDSRGGFRALQAISNADDATFSMDGIKLVRSSNFVDDLIPGVTLQLTESSTGRISLKVQNDREAAKTAIINFVGTYNRLMSEINVLIRQESQIVEELTYLTADEEKTMKDRLGLLIGDSTLNSLRSTLQRITGDVYTTRLDRELALLSQLGISTDSRPPGSGIGIDVSRLRGYLEIDEKKLDQMLALSIEAVKELFGNDTDGDLIIDNGIAYRFDNALRPYIETGGILSLKTTTLDSGISREKRTVESEDKRLASTEAELKRKYGIMEGALNRMESDSASIENFMQRNRKD